MVERTSKRKTAPKKTSGINTTRKPAKRATKKIARRKTAAKRELISPRGDARYIRRDAKGRIKKSDDVVARSERTVRERRSAR